MGQEPYAIGIDLGGTKIDVGLVDASGKILTRELIQTSKAGGDRVVSDIVAATEKLGIGSKNLIGVGVGMAGQIESGTGLVKFAPNLKWTNFPLGSKLGKALGLPATVINDVRAAAWGEWLYGAGKGCDDLICIFVGTGIGGGIVSGGRMLEGASNTAGEVGHITLELDGPVCSCGNRGCFETFAAGWGIARSAKEILAHVEESESLILSLVKGNIDEITAKHVFEAYRSNDPVAVAVIDRAKEALGAGIAALINILNPSRVILGGGIIQRNPDLIDSVKSGVMARALKAATESVAIVGAQLKGDAGVIGAGAAAFNAKKREAR